MSITHISSVSQLNSILEASKTKLSVIDFHATWCPPCHAIAPTFEALSKQYPDVNFLKCDVDAAKPVASAYSISAMPTFIFLKGTTKVDQVRGANKSAIENAVRRYSSSDAAAFAGKGQTLAGDATASESIGNAFTNLDPQIKVFLGLIGAYIVFWYFS